MTTEVAQPATAATPTVPATPPAAVVPPEDEFDAAFAEALADKPVEPTKTAEPVAAAPAEPAEPAEPAAEAPEPGAPVVESETPEARIARLEAENASLRAAPKPAAPATTAAAPESSGAPAQEPAKPVLDTATDPEWYKPTDDEAALIKQFETEWPDIAKAQEIRTKKAAYDAVQYVFHQLAKVYNPQLQRFAELADVISEQLTLSALRNEHEDYDEIYDEVAAWVAKLPTALRRGAQQTMKDGTPEEVTELIGEYKRLHPKQAAAPALPTLPVAPVAQRKTELSAAAKKAAGRLSVVDAKRTTPTAAPDPNDFDGAWGEALKA